MKGLVLAFCLAFAFPGGAALAAEKAHATAGPALEVSAFMRDVEKHKGPVVVEGVVSQVYSKEQRLGLIDAAEFKRCGVVTCATEVLPVRWSGKMPEAKDVVRVEGEVKKGAAGLEFVARSVVKAQSRAGSK